MRVDDYSIQLSQKLKKQIPGYRRGFKDFLYHINKDKNFDAKILKLKVPKKRIKTLSKDKISTLQDACSNLRDKILNTIIMGIWIPYWRMFISLVGGLYY